jgi:hypothetical protein
MVEGLIESMELVRQWVSCGGESDHSLIVLELRGRGRRSPSLFKYFEGWLKDPNYQAMVRGLWIPIEPDYQNHTAVQFLENLKRIKQATITWAHEKKLKEDQEMRYIEQFLQEL